MQKLLTILLITLSWIIPAHSEEGTYKLYKKVLPNGSVEFTDKPGDGYEEILVQEPLKYKGDTRSSYRAGKKDKADYESLDILAPEDGSTYRNLQTPIKVKLRLTPSLKSKHLFHLFVDGQPRAGGFRTSTYHLAGLERGSHKIEVRVLDKRDQTQIESQPITIQVHKTSVGNQNKEAEGDNDGDGGGAQNDADGPSSSFSSPPKPNPKKSAPPSSSFGGYKP